MISRDVEFTIRQSLTGLSLIGDLLRAAEYTVNPDNRDILRQAYTRMVEASQSGDLTSLYRDTLVFAASPYYQLMSVDVNMSNLQFFGAALYEGRFAFGYEPDILSLLSLFLPKDGVFFDVGSNWGYFSIHVLLEPAFSGRVVAIEPAAKSMADLRRLANILKLNDRLTLMQIAAGDCEDKASISQEILSGLNTLGGDHPNGEVVNVSPLDKLNLPDPSFVKIDVEGFEARALKGMRATIERTRPIIVFENWCRPEENESHLEPLEFLHDLGYSLYLPSFHPEARRSAVIPFSARGRLDLVPITPGQRRDYDVFSNVLASPASLSR